ncbi:MAG: sigma-54 factor interaction domain-containing protein [Caulobacteraceae bacterium]|nr:sigma-54 factor interaction domain-containing protein [Caulobacteraceae bacterium]
MKISNNPLEHPALKAQFEADKLAEIEREFIDTKHLIKRVSDWAWYIYATQHEPTRETIRFAIKLNSPAFAYMLEKFSVLIEGPSGTGKELLAGIIGFSGDGAKNVRSLNMAGLTDSLFESQLFGYVPGAFTGALSKGAPGFLRNVGRGFAFLDEIGELPLSQQAKLLRVIQDKTVLPVGAVDPVRIECRFIFATNRDLLSMVKAGTFREDLYFRISQIQLRTYSLSDRGLAEVRHVANEIIRFEKWQPLDADEYIPLELVSLGNVRALFNLLLNRELGRTMLPRLDS